MERTRRFSLLCQGSKQHSAHPALLGPQIDKKRLNPEIAHRDIQDYLRKREADIRDGLEEVDKKSAEDDYRRYRNDLSCIYLEEVM